MDEIALAEISYPSNLRIPSHGHESAFYSFALQGAFSEFDCKLTRLRGPSSLAYRPPDESHAVLFHSTARCLSVQINARRLARLRDQSLILDRPVDFNGGRVVNLARRLYCEFLEMDSLSPLVIEGLMLEIMAETSRRLIQSPDHAAPRWLEQARELLREQFLDKLTLTDVAEAVGRHPVHLAREFNRFYRCTVGEYLRQQRVEFASQLLLASDTPLSEIAVMAGFCDQSHFTRTFKLLTGATPAEYRAGARPR